MFTNWLAFGAMTLLVACSNQKLAATNEAMNYPKGNFTGYDSVNYALAAKAGQTMNVKITTRVSR